MRLFTRQAQWRGREQCERPVRCSAGLWASLPHRTSEPSAAPLNSLLQDGGVQRLAWSEAEREWAATHCWARPEFAWLSRNCRDGPTM
jgi:hypothetical protein